jgi:hypothetical protein
MVALVGSGLPFQVAAERRYDRSARPARLRPALAAGKTVFVPQAHQVLPRVMRLIVALRAAFLGAGREECSFLFLVEGTGREGLGLHHDGEVHAFWLQLEGQRTVTLGRPVPRGSPQDLPARRAGERGFTTRTLSPGSLLYMPPRTPHRVVCFGRSLALSLTWSVERRGAGAEALAAWDVVSGRVLSPPPVSQRRAWTQVPAVAVGVRGDTLVLTLPDGVRAHAPRTTQRVARALAMMASFSRAALGDAWPALIAQGVVAPQDLPQAVAPAAPSALDGWRFA